MGTPVTVETRDHGTVGGLLTSGCDPWDRLPVTTTTGVPPPTRTPDHQINAERHNPPPCKTNYLSILHCQVPSAFCLCALQLVQQSIKKWGRHHWPGRGVRGGVSNKLSVQMKVQPKREGVRDKAKLLDFLHDTEMQHRLFPTLPPRPSLSELPNYSSLEHRLPISATLPSLYTTSVRTIRLLWIFMTGLKSHRCHKVAVIRIQRRLLLSVDRLLVYWGL